MKDYQASLNKGKDIELMGKIIRQMLDDAEAIPVMYTGLVHFYNRELFDARDMNFSEGHELWRFLRN